MVEKERISGSLPSRGRKAPEVRSIIGSERDRDRDSRDEDLLKRRSDRDRNKEKLDGGVVADAGGSDSGLWFAGYAAENGPDGSVRGSVSESGGSQMGMTL